MPRLEDQTIDSSVQIFDAVYEVGGVWFTADSVTNKPTGIYEGNKVVVTSFSKTQGAVLTFESIFLGDEIGEFSGNITILSDADNSPTDIETYAQILDLSLRAKIEKQLKEEYTEFEDVDAPVDAQYIDFDMSCLKNPNTNDIPKKLDEGSVMQSIKNLVLNDKLWGGRGSSVRNMLFDLQNIPFYETTVIEVLEQRLRSQEPRLGILNLQIYPSVDDDKTVVINVQFSLKNHEKVLYDFPIFVRIR